MLDKDNVLFIKIKNKGNQIEKYKIPYESEKNFFIHQMP